MSDTDTTTPPDDHLGPDGQFDIGLVLAAHAIEELRAAGTVDFRADVMPAIDAAAGEAATNPTTTDGGMGVNIVKAARAAGKAGPWGTAVQTALDALRVAVVGELSDSGTGPSPG